MRHEREHTVISDLTDRMDKSKQKNTVANCYGRHTDPKNTSWHTLLYCTRNFYSGFLC